VASASQCLSVCLLTPACVHSRRRAKAAGGEGHRPTPLPLATDPCLPILPYDCIHALPTMRCRSWTPGHRGRRESTSYAVVSSALLVYAYSGCRACPTSARATLRATFTRSTTPSWCSSPPDAAMPGGRGGVCLRPARGRYSGKGAPGRFLCARRLLNLDTRAIKGSSSSCPIKGSSSRGGEEVSAVVRPPVGVCLVPMGKAAGAAA
jgi:hypothetical protein